MKDWNGKQVLVTGASRGLGLEFSRALAERGASVVATCRAPDEATALRGLRDEFPAIRIARLDTGEPTSAEVIAGSETFDVLINNAGIATSGHPIDPIVGSQPAELMRVLQTNVSGTIATTNALLPALRKGRDKTIVMMTSDLGSIEGTFTAQSTTVQAGGVSSYRISKAGINMAARIYAAELADEGFTVVALTPGWVATEMGSAGGREAPLSPRESIAGCLKVIASLTTADNGSFRGYDGRTLPW